jgi:ABC-2 type transport system permease protein
MRFDRIYHILLKEFIEIRRDKWAIFRLLFPPLLQMLIFGYAATFEVYHVSTVILDRDHSQESRELISHFVASRRFDLVRYADSEKGVRKAIDSGDATVGITIQPRFAALLQKGQPAPLQVVVDGTNSNTALIALGYVGQIVATYSQNYLTQIAPRFPGGPKTRFVQVDMSQRPWFNPDLNGRWFFVPGVVGTLSAVLTVTLTASAIVREREIGTLEQIMVSPIKPYEFILGKTIPFFVIGFAETALVAVFGILWFHIPFVGNPIILAVGTTLFLLSTLGLGILISTLVRTQQQAFGTNFFVTNPIFTLSGFSFPIASMPEPMQWLTYLNPLRYYLIVIRATFLKGVGFSVLWPDLLGMAAIATGLLSFSILRFRKALD